MYYQEIFQGRPSENFLKKLKQQSDSIISELNKIREDRLKKNTFSSTSVSLSPLTQDIGSRIIEANISLEEQQSFNELLKELGEKENKLKFLNQQLTLYNEELHSLVYPKHLKFGFISFGLFAFLGVIIPLMHQWWSPYFKYNSDAFCFYYVSNWPYYYLCIYFIRNIFNF